MPLSFSHFRHVKDKAIEHSKKKFTSGNKTPGKELYVHIFKQCARTKITK